MASTPPPRWLAVFVLLLGPGCSDEVVGYGDTLGNSSEPETLPDYVAAGLEQGLAVSFDDGASWLDIADPPVEGEVTRESMARAPDSLIVVGAFGTLFTEDGMVWTGSTDIEAGYARAAAYGNDRYVVVGPGRLSWSTDGMRWNDARNGATDFDLWDVAYGDGRFVAVGWGSMAVSTDGENWTLSAFEGPKLFSVAYGNGRFVAVGEEGHLAVTEDGQTFTHQVLDGPGLDDVCFFDDEFVVLGGGRAWLTDTGEGGQEVPARDAFGLECGADSMVTQDGPRLSRGEGIESRALVHTLAADVYTLGYTGP